MTTEQIIEILINRYPPLNVCKKEIREAGHLIIDLYRNSGKLLVCGNGGSSSDSDHIVGELMKSFSKKRPIDAKFSERLMSISGDRGSLIASNIEVGLPAISLNAHSGLLSAIANDIGCDFIFAQQVGTYGRNGDILLGITTSGNSQNVVDACITAKAKGLTVIGLVGESGGKIEEYCDVAICVPSLVTAEIQEFHLPIYHSLCMMAEEAMF